MTPVARSRAARARLLPIARKLRPLKVRARARVRRARAQNLVTTQLQGAGEPDDVAPIFQYALSHSFLRVFIQISPSTSFGAQIKACPSPIPKTRCLIIYHCRLERLDPWLVLA